MIAQTLGELDKWFGECTASNDRSTLLSKLALLELCGWLECELDRLILVAESGRLNDSAWVSKEVLSRVSGFTYDRHFRPMLTRIIGEVYVRRTEDHFDATHPGELAQLKPFLEVLWKDRCLLAHTNIGAAIPQQVTYKAPSWWVAQHQTASSILANYERALVRSLAAI